MKLYTLTYDCNTPTKQQVNIPTNTDYKLGIKVRRNGEIQNLSPNSVKLYTGETYTIEPTNLSVGSSSSLVSDSTTLLILAKDTTEIAGQDIDARNIFVEASYDDGATWSKLALSAGGDYSFYVRVNDRSAGTNNWIAYADLADPNRKWHLYEGGVDTGKTTQTLKMPSVVWLVINGPQAGHWGLAQYPAVIRLVVGIGGGTFERYIEPDDDKTNGYVTFTLSANDNASYTNEKLDIEKGYDAEFYKPAFVKQNATGAAEVVTIISAELSDFVGYTLKPEDIYYSAMYRPSELSVAEIEENFGPYWRVNELAQTAVEFKPFIEDKDGNVKMYLIVSQAWYNEYCNALGWPIDKPGFFVPNPDNPANMMIVDSYTVQEGDKLVMGKGLSVSKDRYYGGKIRITAGTPFSAKFGLNTNIFKSQQGDLAEPSIGQETVNISGKFSDNTDFDYDFVVA